MPPEVEVVDELKKLIVAVRNMATRRPLANQFLEQA
jgi:hypothetical protein